MMKWILLGIIVKQSTRRVRKGYWQDLYLCEVSDIQEILIRNGVYRQNAKGKGGAAGYGIKRGKRKRKKVSA